MGGNNDQYTDIAELYKDSKQLPFRKYVEEYTLLQIIGDIQGKTVVDLACGDGFYTRKLKQMGAKEVLGIDLSAEMIQLAKNEEEKNPIGCRYIQGDAANISDFDKSDLVVAAYLLNYAKTKEQLLSFCKTAHSVLKPEGHFIGISDNINNPPKGVVSFSQYGFEKECSPSPKEGDPINYTIMNTNGEKFKFQNFYLKPETYQWAFKEAGFSYFEWKKLLLEPSQRDNSAWDELLSNPPMLGFCAEKK